MFHRRCGLFKIIERIIVLFSFRTFSGDALWRRSLWSQTIKSFSDHLCEYWNFSFIVLFHCHNTLLQLSLYYFIPPHTHSPTLQLHKMPHLYIPYRWHFSYTFHSSCNRPIPHFTPTYKLTNKHAVDTAVTCIHVHINGNNKMDD